MDNDPENDQNQSMKKDINQKFPVSSSPETQLSGDGNGKLLIKLKLPKAEQGDGEQTHVQTRVCEVCYKVFSNGKALGGHMRVHLQPKAACHRKLKPTKCKKQRQQVIDTSKNRDCNGSTNVEPTCPLCSKNFPSMKSLFGHMRCHPEREWRGIQPPPGAKNYMSDQSYQTIDGQIDSEAAMGNQVTDLTQSLWGWSTTGRRSGGKELAATSAAPSISEEERFLDAVQDLMRFAKGNSLESGLTHNFPEEFEATNSNSLTNKAEIEDKNGVSESKKRRINASPVGYRRDCPVKKLKIEERGSSYGGNSDVTVKNSDKGKEKLISMQWIDSDWNSEDDDDDDGSDSKNATTQMMTKNKIKIKKRKKLSLRDLELVRDGNPVDHEIQISKSSIAMPKTTVPHHRYKCSSCNRYFATHQALGGHRSSHNKVINCQNTIDESSSAAGEDEHQANPISQVYETKEREGAASSKLTEESTHQCNICLKIFPTGQALGGHKRCHWTSTVEGPSSQVTSPGETSHTGRKILGFDLNELPAVEYDQEGIEHEADGYGYTSSSYNSAA